MDSYRALLLSLDAGIGQDDLSKMKSACRDNIGLRELEKITRPLQLFEALENRALLGRDNKNFLAELFVAIGRRDLKFKFLGIEEEPGSPQRTVSNAPVVTGILTESHLNDIAVYLPCDWKQLARKLGVSETVIENVDEDNNKAKEKVYQLLLSWKRSNGQDANGQVLSDALTLTSRRDVAEKLAEICSVVPVQQMQSPVRPTDAATNPGPFPTMQEDLQPHLPEQNVSGGAVSNASSAPHDIDQPDSSGVPVMPLNNQPPARVPDQETGATNSASSHISGQEQRSSDANTGVAVAWTRSSVTTGEPLQETMPPDTETSPPAELQFVLDPARYNVLKIIGSGLCGKVYLCKTKDGSQAYAVKQVNLGMNSNETKKQVRILKKEIAILEKLRHEYIVKVSHTEDTEYALSIFMEYLPKGSIFDRLDKSGVINEHAVRRYTHQILRGCEYLHGQNVIHMDIKGANILIDDCDNVRLVDFGISKDMEKVLTSTKTTGYFGTVFWSSPELLNNERPSYLFDVWGIGCTVVEMLTKKPPNYHLNNNAALLKISTRDVHPPEGLSEMAKEFVELCFKAKEERPNATTLLEHEFPEENVPES